MRIIDEQQLLILNGRYGQDSAETTYEAIVRKKQGNETTHTTIDYALCRQDMADKITSMTVETNNDAGVLSDHRPLWVSLQCKQRQEQQANEQDQGKGPQWHPPVDRALMDISCIATSAWEEEGLKEKYQGLLKKNLREAGKELRNMKHQRGPDATDTNSINAVYDQLTKGIIKAAEQYLPILEGWPKSSLETGLAT